MEFLDIVNTNDTVIGRASREEVYKQKLTHRIAHVFVFNTQGKLLLQLRSGNVDFFPHCWVTSVGGHVMSGETPEQAAHRETMEEIGVKLKLAPAYYELYDDPRGLKKFLYTFTAEHNGPFTHDAHDVTELRFVPLQKVWGMIRDGEPFHPELLFLLNKHYKSADV